MHRIEGQLEVFDTKGGVTITRSRVATAYASAIDSYIDALDERRGAVFSSNYEYPGRYTRWDTAIIDPPVVITSNGRHMTIEALNKRGEVLLLPIKQAMEKLEEITISSTSETKLELEIALPTRAFTEEERSRIPSVFTVLRGIVALFFTEDDANLGLYGAFGYDLAFQFDPIEYKLKRPDDQRDIVLYLPDEILVVDHHAAKAWLDRYDYAYEGKSTEGPATRHCQKAV